jgi:hypothetical protein
MRNAFHFLLEGLSERTANPLLSAVQGRIALARMDAFPRARMIVTPG